MVKVNSGGRRLGRALRSPGNPDRGQEGRLDHPGEEASDYDETFKDPLPHDEGGTDGPVEGVLIRCRSRVR